jgi:hypothetical protein
MLVSHPFSALVRPRSFSALGRMNEIADTSTASLALMRPEAGKLHTAMHNKA